MARRRPIPSQKRRLRNGHGRRTDRVGRITVFNRKGREHGDCCGGGEAEAGVCAVLWRDAYCGSDERRCGEEGEGDLSGWGPGCGEEGVVLDCAGVPSSIKGAFLGVKTKGMVVNVAIWEKEVPFQPNWAVFGEKRFCAGEFLNDLWFGEGGNVC